MSPPPPVRPAVGGARPRLFVLLSLPLCRSVRGVGGRGCRSHTCPRSVVGAGAGPEATAPQLGRGCRPAPLDARPAPSWPPGSGVAAQVLGGHRPECANSFTRRSGLGSCSHPTDGETEAPCEMTCPRALSYRVEEGGRAPRRPGACRHPRCLSSAFLESVISAPAHAGRRWVNVCGLTDETAPEVRALEGDISRD